MKVAIHQPQYLPWLGYLAKWAAADLFVFLDTVQYEKHGWQNRNRIKSAHGPQWLTVPVRARLGTAIRDVAIDDTQPWRRRHRTAIHHAYARARGHAGHADGLARLYEPPWRWLGPLAVESATWLARAIGITTPAVLASDLTLRATDRTERLVEICRAVGATAYLSGRDGVRYLAPEPFVDASITVLRQRYEHPVYAQRHGPFAPFLSGLDVLLAEGDAALRIVRSGDAWEPLVAWETSRP